MEYVALIWVLFGLMNIGGYAASGGGTYRECFVFAIGGPITSFIYAGFVAVKKMS